MISHKTCPKLSIQFHDWICRACSKRAPFFPSASSCSTTVLSVGSTFRATINIKKYKCLTKVNIRMLVLYDVLIKEVSLNILLSEVSRFRMNDFVFKDIKMPIINAVAYCSIMIQYSSSSSFYEPVKINRILT